MLQAIDEAVHGVTVKIEFSQGANHFLLNFRAFFNVSSSCFFFEVFVLTLLIDSVELVREGFYFSDEFKSFMHANGVRHITSAPYHPSTNGLAERAVQTFKQALRQMEGESVEDKLARFLLNYRITPHSTTGVSPAELLMGRKLRTRFDLWLPDLQMSVEKKQWKQKQCHDKKKPVREFKTGQKVYAEEFASKS